MAVLGNIPSNSEIGIILDSNGNTVMLEQLNGRNQLPVHDITTRDLLISILHELQDIRQLLLEGLS